jgi:nuclear pore complex protein Nup205
MCVGSGCWLAAVQLQTDTEMFSASIFALGELPSFPPFCRSVQISINLFFTGYGSDTKFDVNKRQKERMMRKCVIEYIGAASEFIGTILFILCSSAIDLPADAESEITPVLSPITTMS